MLVFQLTRIVEDATWRGGTISPLWLSHFPLDPVRYFHVTYEGWQGQVYKRQYAKNTFSRECLGEYCQYQYQGEPLFRTVGNDSTFYRPPTANQLRHYLEPDPRRLSDDVSRCGGDHHSELREAASVWCARAGQPESALP